MFGTHEKDPQSDRLHVQVIDCAGGVPTIFKIKPTTELGRLMKIYADQKGVDPGQMQFLFNDLRIANNDTPQSLHIKDKDMIHAIIYFPYFMGDLPKSVSPCLSQVDQLENPTDPNAPGSSKKPSPDWTPAEEKQLVMSWLNVSEQPLLRKHHPGQTFYNKVELDFNQYSKTHYRPADEIRTHWAALNAATYRFNTLYDSIKQNPPSGSSPSDWLSSAHDLYLEQNKVPFKSLPAWEQLCSVLRWRKDVKGSRPKLLELGCDVIDQTVGSAGVCIPSSSNFCHPPGPKSTKRKRLNSAVDAEDKNVKAAGLQTNAKELVSAILEENAIAKAQNEVSLQQIELEKKKIKIEEDKLDLEKRHLAIQDDHHLSEVRVNDLRLLQCKGFDLDDEGKKVLNMMKKQILEKWSSQSRA